MYEKKEFMNKNIKKLSSEIVLGMEYKEYKFSI